MSKQSLRLGTRGSMLALTQSRQVADELEKLHADLQVELIIIKTTGDIITDKPLHEEGGKGLFTKEIEIALLRSEVDFAVHSYKDVPVTMPLVSVPADFAGLVIAATPTREDCRDVLAFGAFQSPEAASNKTTPMSLMEIPTGLRIGTGSLRRACQIRHHRPDLQILPIRGNIDTRLRKLHDKEFDAVVLAMAGLHRTRLFDENQMCLIEPDFMVPASCQGALALQCRADDQRTKFLLNAVHDADTELCVNAEREIIAGFNGDCKSPIGALATLTGDEFHLRVFAGSTDGLSPALSHFQSGKKADSKVIIGMVLQWFIARNVQLLLHPH